MKKMKRLVAFIICMATLASLCAFSVSVSAQDAGSTPEIVVTEADYLLIEKLEAMDMITNEYDPAGYVTRRQTAEIVAHYMRLTVSGSDATSPFRDVATSDPAFASIVTLYDLGVITGDDQKKFNPDSYVTYDEALVFIINAIGHKMFAVREGGYPTGYHRVAIKHDMLKDLSMQKGSDPVRLIDLYKMLDNGSGAATVIPQYYGDGDVTYTLSDTDTFLSENYGIWKYRGKVTGNEYTKLTTADLSLKTEQIEIDGVVYDTPGYYYDYFLGYTVDYYLKQNASGSESEMIYIEESKKYNSKISIDSEDIIMSKVTGSRIYYYDEEYEEQHISLDSSYLDVIYNNQAFSAYTDLVNALPQNEMGYIEALDNNNDGNYDVLFVYEYENVIVGNVDTYEEKIYDEITSSDIDLDSSKHDIVIRNSGESKKQTMDAIEKDDILSIVKSKGTEKVIFIYISRDIVNGKITGHSSDLGWMINDEYYEASYAYTATSPLSVGLSGNFYLDMNGKIVTYKYDDSESTAQFAAVAGIQKGKSTLSPSITLKLFTQKGEFVYAELNDVVKIDNYKFDITEITENTNAIKYLTNNYPDGQGGYKVNTAYLVIYKTNTLGKITEIDTGAIGGPGRLNAIIENGSEMLVRSGGMMAMTNAGGKVSEASADQKVYARFNSESGFIFSVPEAGDVENEDMYNIETTLEHDTFFYSHSDRTGYDPVAGFAVYDTGKYEMNYADVVLFYGKAPSSVSTISTGLSVVTSVADAVNEDGESVKKIYYNDGEFAIVEPKIKFTKYETTTLDVDADTVIGAGKDIQPGTVIQFSTTITGEINEISVVAFYNDATGAFSPAFGASSSVWMLGEVENGEVSGLNTVSGTIIANDPETNMVTFTTTGSDVHLFTTTNAKGVYRVFRSEREGVETITYKDLQPGDKFVARLSSYYATRDLIVLR